MPAYADPEMCTIPQSSSEPQVASTAPAVSNSDQMCALAEATPGNHDGGTPMLDALSMLGMGFSGLKQLAGGVSRRPCPPQGYARACE